MAGDPPGTGGSGRRESSTKGRAVSTGGLSLWREVLPTWWGVAVAVALATGCAADGPLLPPVGSWDVQVGTTWSRKLVAVGGSDGVWQWRIVHGPGALLIGGTTRTAQLFWTPSAFDLAPTAAGHPRAAGAAQPLQVEATDGAGMTAVSLGALRAVPTGR